MVQECAENNNVAAWSCVVGSVNIPVATAPTTFLPLTATTEPATQPAQPFTFPSSTSSVTDINAPPGFTLVPLDVPCDEFCGDFNCVPDAVASITEPYQMAAVLAPFNVTCDTFIESNFTAAPFVSMDGSQVVCTLPSTGSRPTFCAEVFPFPHICCCGLSEADCVVPPPPPPGWLLSPARQTCDITCGAGGCTTGPLMLLNSPAAVAAVMQQEFGVACETFTANATAGLLVADTPGECVFGAGSCNVAFPGFQALCCCGDDEAACPVPAG